MMDKIDQVGMMVAAIGKCCLCDNESGDIYMVDFVLADGSHISLTWHICQECRALIQDRFSDWVPVFCVNCRNAGWMRRSENKNIPDGCVSAFVDGCHACTGVCAQGWYLTNLM
jgi:hypothetical protein